MCDTNWFTTKTINNSFKNEQEASLYQLTNWSGKLAGRWIGNFQIWDTKCYTTIHNVCVLLSQVFATNVTITSYSRGQSFWYYVRWFKIQNSKKYQKISKIVVIVLVLSRNCNRPLHQFLGGSSTKVDPRISCIISWKRKRVSNLPKCVNYPQ